MLLVIPYLSYLLSVMTLLKNLIPQLHLEIVSLEGAGCGSNIVARSGSGATIRIVKTETKWRLLVGNISDHV